VGKGGKGRDEMARRTFVKEIRWWKLSHSLVLGLEVVLLRKKGERGEGCQLRVRAREERNTKGTKK